MAVTNTKTNLNIYQNFLRTPTELTQTLRALIIGAHYFLCRYTDASEKSDIGRLGAYDPVLGGEYAWPQRPVGAVVDEAYTRLLIDDALLRYYKHVPAASASDNVSVTSTAAGYANQLRDAVIVWRTANTYDRSTILYDRDVQVGDVAYITGTDSNGDAVAQWNTVAGFLYDPVDAQVDTTPTPDASNASTPSSAASSVDDSTPTGLTNATVSVSHAAFDAKAYGRTTEVYTMVCIQAGDITTARFNAISASGTDNVYGLQLEALDGSVSTTTFGSYGAKVIFTASGNVAIEAGTTVTLTYTQSYTAPTCTGGGDYTGAADRTYIVRIVGITAETTPDSIVAVVTSTDGTDGGGPYILSVGIPQTIGSFGVTVSFDGLPVPGDKFYIACTASANGPCHTLLLRRSLPSTLVDDEDLGLILYIKKNIELVAGTDFTHNADGIVVPSGLSAEDASWADNGRTIPMAIDGGTLFIHYRALRTEYSTGRSENSDSSLVATTYGPTVTDNPFAMGIYCALENSQSVPVGSISVDEDSSAGYIRALDKIKDDPRCYSIVVLSQDPDIQDAVQAHVDAQSTAARHRWRLGWLNSACPTQIGVSTVTDGDTAILATIGPRDIGGSNILLTVPDNDANFVTDLVQARDVVRTNYQPDGTYDEYVVEEVVSEDSLILNSGPAVAITTAVKVEVWHNQTADQQAAAYAARTAHFADRRIRHVWPDTVELEDGTPVPGYYACAALAGQKSSAAPHQSLTGVALIGFGTVRRSTVDMSEAQLDAMAAVGTWVLTQEAAGGAVYTRMGLTTDDTDANHWQDIRTSNADSLCFGLYNRLLPLIRGANINDRLLKYISNEIMAVKYYYMSEANNPDLGPQLLDLSLPNDVYIHPSLQDTVVAPIRMSLPYELGALEMPIYIS